MQVFWNKRKSLHKKRVQLPEDWFGTPTWPPFLCFGTPIWPPWRHVKTLYNYEQYKSYFIWRQYGSWNEEWSSHLWTQFMQLRKKPEKNSGLQRDLNPWPPDTGAVLDMHVMVNWQLSKKVSALITGSGQFFKVGIQFALFLRKKLNYLRKKFLKRSLEGFAFGLG